MRVRSTSLAVCALSAVLVVAACHRSRSDSTPTLAVGTIGPEGGVLVVGSGAQTGLVLTIPPGALTSPTQVRIVDVATEPAPGTYQLSSVPQPGLPFRIEPSGLRLEERATLRAPYRPAAVGGTGPGNVRVREVRGAAVIDYAPDVVDVVGGFVELPVRWLGQYVVIRGPVAAAGSYWPALATSIALDDGYTFEVADVPETSPFHREGVLERWRLNDGSATAPKVDFYLADKVLLGRECVDGSWREVWSSPFPFWTDNGSPVAGPAAMTMPTQVSAPVAWPPLGGQITVSTEWTYAPPMTVAGRMLFDVLKVRLQMAWNRHDLGVGQREYELFFAPDVGVVAIAEDGVRRSRTTW